MLEGLEVSVISFSDLYFDNRTIRIDSEYLKKEYLANNDSILKFKNGFKKLNEYIEHLSGGATPLGAEYYEIGIPFLRVQNIMPNHFNLTDIVYLSKEQDEEIKRSRLKENDVLLTITGVSYGKSAVIPKWLENSNINQHSVKITLKETLNPYFLSTFLNCKFGKLQSDKNIVGVTRPALDYDVIRNYNIPILKQEFQIAIEKSIKYAYEIEGISKNLYTEAETILLQELGLQDWQPSKKSSSVKTLRESLLQSGRLDAEYYQAKYDELFNVVTKYKDGYVQLSDLRKEYSTGFPFDSDRFVFDGFPLIRISNIKKGKLDLSDAATIPQEDVELSKKDIVKENDLLLSMSGTIGNCCKVPEGIKAIINQRILRFSVKDFDVDVLCLLINSIVCELQLQRVGTGGVQTNISGSDIFNMRIPKINPQIQKTIADKIQQSFALQSKSKQLLESAKTAVEIAIEQDEDVALDYISQHLFTK